MLNEAAVQERIAGKAGRSVVQAESIRSEVRGQRSGDEDRLLGLDKS